MSRLFSFNVPFATDRSLLTSWWERNIAVRGPPLPNEGLSIWKDSHR